jgi:hypothetical protein
MDDASIAAAMEARQLQYQQQVCVCVCGWRMEVD